MPADTILHNTKIATNAVPTFVEALAITGGKIAAAGTEQEVFQLRGPKTKVIDGKGRTAIPGLNDSHMHPIRGGLNYNMELRWDGVTEVPCPKSKPYLDLQRQKDPRCQPRAVFPRPNRPATGTALGFSSDQRECRAQRECCAAGATRATPAAQHSASISS